MVGIGIVLAWFGYAVLYYGINQITGGNESFASLVVPGRYAPVARDSAPAQTGGGSQIAPKPSNPGGVAVLQPTTPPKGAKPGCQYAVDQDGHEYVKCAGQGWVPYAAQSGGQPYGVT